LFSAFECALKQKGFVIQPNLNSPKAKKAYQLNKFAAQPDWDTFSKKYYNRFNPNESQKLKDAWNYFVNDPPRKQILNNNTLDWSEPNAYTNQEKKLTWLINSVKTVRNNLFHGGKYLHVKVEEPTRNSELLRHSIVILNSCLSLSKDVASRVSEILNEEDFY
jgi:hypothetical protein